MRRSLRDWAVELRERAKSAPYDENRPLFPFKDIFAIIIALFQLASPLILAAIIVAVVVALILSRG